MHIQSTQNDLHINNKNLYFQLALIFCPIIVNCTACNYFQTNHTYKSIKIYSIHSIYWYADNVLYKVLYDVWVCVGVGVQLEREALLDWRDRKEIVLQPHSLR